MSDVSTRTETNPERIRQLILCLDGLRYSGAIAQNCYDRISERLRSFEHQAQHGVPTGEVVHVVSDLWSLIDAVYRMRLLIDRIPLFPKRAPEVRIFLNATTPIESLRHYVQHINNEIGTLPPSAPPLWGTVSWVSSTDPSKYFTLVTGSQHLAQSLQGLVFDTHTGTFVRRFEFAAGTTTINVDDIFRRVQSINDIIREWANTIKFEGGPTYEYDPAVTGIIHFTFKMNEQTGSNPTVEG